MKQILNIAHYEIMHIFRERVLLAILFIVPLLYASMFGMVYVSAILQHVPLGIVDLDHSQESRAVVSAFENTSNFKVIPQVSTYADLEAGMKNGLVRAGVVIPADYSQKLAQHQLTQILTVYDGSNLIYGFNTRKYFQQVLNTFSAEHTASYLSGLGMTKQEITNVMDMVSYSMEVWYNPTFSYATFIFMGLVLMIIQQIGLLGIGLTVTREKEENSWLQFLCAAVPQWKIFMGKALPYFIANFFNYGLLLWIAARFVNVKIEGSVGLILLLGLLFDLIIISAGFIVSVYFPNSLLVTRYLMLISVPIFVASGYSWPSTHIPVAINMLLRTMPYTWMAEGFRLLTVKNLSFAYIADKIMVLILMAAATTFFALTFPKRRKPPAQIGTAVNSALDLPNKNL
ncbi:ABC-type multidrug transport system, permease component [Desulfosporosinus orientis DSM 765]|uniref:ABC-type multidrug transport system, permease component n=1 Tax=Desulfosporosinus orientis (strain ATCC 19365 / DSM 765 / NCIMB 8382 / VKM B-1628 / Singapore I) TaxID=768706 RepID=G7W8D8_DESOD|nr:ABC transporter permease [Desulfosporosinus orientis]AET67078.1 ABC-type multidrug transport system, permease component [Desulfosporosinus orientis DSM 765]